MGWTRACLAGAAVLIAVPATAWAAAGGIPGAPLIAALAAVAGLSVAIAAWLLLRRQIAAAAEASALRRDLGRLGIVLGASPDGFYAWSADGSETCSERLAGWLGTTPEAVKRFDELAPYFQPDGFATLREAIGRLREEGAPFSLTLQTADGGRTFAATGAQAGAPAGAAPAHILWLRDATEEKAQAARLAAEAAEAAADRDQFRELLDAEPFPVWRRGDDLNLTWCNKAYAAAVETEAEKAVTVPGIELAPGDAPEQARALAQRVLETGASQTEIRQLGGDGVRRALEIVETPLGPGRGIAGFARDITDLKEATAELRRHIEAHAEVLESLTTPLAIYGPDQRLKFFNSAFVRLWQLDEGWLATEPFHGEILEDLRERRRLPEQADFPAFKKERLDFYTSLTEPREEVFYLPDGTTLQLRISRHPFGGVLFLYEDVTNRLELERARNTLIAVQRATLDNLHEGVAVFGADGRLKLFNPSYARIWQLDEELLASEPHVSDIVEQIKDLLAWVDDWDSLKALIVGRATDRTPRSLRLERPDGTVIDYACVPLPDGNMLNTYLDVTDSIRVERALRERNEALETADRLKSEFVASVSYELRTPLTAIIGFTEILTNEYFGSLNARQKEYGEGILDSSNHLLDLINDILDLATIEAGHMELELGRVNLHAMLASMLEFARAPALRQKLSVELDCPPDIGPIEADHRRLKQVLFNMMSNAMRFTAPGGTVGLGARRDADRVALWVADNGVGIPLEEQQRVFGKFHKSTGQKGHTPGAGLGLSLVKSFIGLHGGHVELDSTPGVGTRVTCYLPAKAQARAQRAAAAGD